jgi:citrate synthase
LTAETSAISTGLASHDPQHIWIRDLDLVTELMGQVSFTGMVGLMLMGRVPDEPERAVLDAVLVTLVDHGLTPSAMVARVTYGVAPEALQGAVAAGLLGAGSLILGSMEDCGRMLTEFDREVAGSVLPEQAARNIVERYRAAGRRIPGIGHNIHVHGDPRADRLFEIAAEHRIGGNYVEALQLIAGSAASMIGSTLPINATGAISAVLLGLGIPWQLHRGIALISRTVGLVAHIGEELEAPITPAVRTLLRKQSERAPGTNQSA